MPNIYLLPPEGEPRTRNWSKAEVPLDSTDRRHARGHSQSTPLDERGWPFKFLTVAKIVGHSKRLSSIKINKKRRVGES